MSDSMSLAEALERLKAEKGYAEYALMHNTNDDKYRSLVNAVDVVTDAVGKMCDGLLGISVKHLKQTADYCKQFKEDELPFP